MHVTDLLQYYGLCDVRGFPVPGELLFAVPAIINWQMIDFDPFNFDHLSLHEYCLFFKYVHNGVYHVSPRHLYVTYLRAHVTVPRRSPREDFERISPVINLSDRFAERFVQTYTDTWRVKRATAMRSFLICTFSRNVSISFFFVPLD